MIKTTKIIKMDENENVERKIIAKVNKINYSQVWRKLKKGSITLNKTFRISYNK